jgi:hypothetical protein
MTEYNRDAIRKECSKRLQIAGFTHVAYNHIVSNDRGRVVIPLALLDEDGNPSVAIRVRKPRKRQSSRDKTTSKRSETITHIAGCHTITIHSMAGAALLPQMVKKLFDL